MSTSTTPILARALRLFAQLGSGEGLLALLVLACVFSIPCARYALETAREGLSSSDMSGLGELEVYATGAMATLGVIVVLVTGVLIAKLRRPPPKNHWSLVMRPILATLALVLATSSSKDVAAEPTTLPGDESGRVDERDRGDSVPRLVARGVLFVPRVMIQTLLAPVEGGVYLYDRYQIPARLHRLMWNDANTIGLLPTVHLESGFGLNAGGHLVLRDLLDRGVEFDLRGNAGGRFSQRYAASVYSGRLFGDTFAIGSMAEYERRPRDRFYGIGNTDELAMQPSAQSPIGGGVSSKFRHDVARVTAVADARLGHGVLVRTAGALADHELAGTGTADSISTAYMTDQLAGFPGYRTAYGEIEVRWDTRRTADPNEAASNYSTGGLLSAFAGRVHGLARTQDFWRYGGDAQRFLWLAQGPRVLLARLHAEGVTGDVDQMPFDELPGLGGKDLLRGYVGDRFRDRLAVVGSLEYRWDLAKLTSASVFADAGRVYRSPGDLELDGLRVGYGVSLEAHTDSSFVARVSLSSSIDGGMFIDFSLDPVFAVAGRVQRK